ncbi:differentiation regulator (Nrd1) [Ascosphaera apis ARSEF 7405]|uniref:Differentiation regulator (Nrd1) n=1 Tax=Ascosphaera apis ARSEF 7405 TaxID=392613 RepID=A0A168C9B5_9EURO|nr:differentiation regulator (Nrd1) [Ascosphaera apis ARSEF 7405]
MSLDHSTLSKAAIYPKNSNVKNDGDAGRRNNPAPRSITTNQPEIASYPIPSTASDHSGIIISHNRSFSNRDRRIAINVPSINTAGAASSVSTNGNPVASSADVIITSATSPGNFDMSFTPLLPSGLLLGSPLQPHHPAAAVAAAAAAGYPTYSSPLNGIATPGHGYPHHQHQHQHSHPHPHHQQHQHGHPLVTAAPPPSHQQQPLHSPTAQSNGGPHTHTHAQLGGINSLNAHPNNNLPSPHNYGGHSHSQHPQHSFSPAASAMYPNMNHLNMGMNMNLLMSDTLNPPPAPQMYTAGPPPGPQSPVASAGVPGVGVGFTHAPFANAAFGTANASLQLPGMLSGASRTIYLGNLPSETTAEEILGHVRSGQIESVQITDEELREDLGKFGPIDTIKIVREKNIAFIHYLSISNAIKAVAQLPQEAKYQAPRRVNYGKDRCAYVSKTQQQNAAQYLGIAPGYAHVLNSTDRDLISTALAQQSVAAAAVATTAGGVNNLGNRTVYLGNIHPETTLEEICNVVRGGLLHHIRYIPDKHICFVTFIDPTAAASFYALSNLQGLMIHNRRLKVGWGKHSGALPPAIALAVSGGASRNVYIGNLDGSWTEEKLRNDFNAYGEIELVNTLREKSCAFVNFTNIANAIKAIEGMQGRAEYQRFKINFGKDRCGNAPRHVGQNGQHKGNGDGVDNQSSTNENGNGRERSPAQGSNGSHHDHKGHRHGGNAGLSSQKTPSAILNAGNNNPLTMYLAHISQQQAQAQAQAQAHAHAHAHHAHIHHDNRLHDPVTIAIQHQQQAGFYNPSTLAPSAADHSNGSSPLPLPTAVPTSARHQASKSSVPAFVNTAPSPDPSSVPVTTVTATTSTPTPPTGSATSGNTLAIPRSAAHSRAVSLPSFSQDPPFATPAVPHHQPRQSVAHAHPAAHSAHQTQASFGGFASGLSGFGISIQDGTGAGGLPGWVEEEVGTK